MFLGQDVLTSLKLKMELLRILTSHTISRQDLFCQFQYRSCSLINVRSMVQDTKLHILIQFGLDLKVDRQIVLIFCMFTFLINFNTTALLVDLIPLLISCSQKFFSSYFRTFQGFGLLIKIHLIYTCKSLIFKRNIRMYIFLFILHSKTFCTLHIQE